MIETVDSEKLAKEIDKQVSKIVTDAKAANPPQQPHFEVPLRVLVQVNTSNEDGTLLSGGMEAPCSRI
jgi:uncharacterized pyridoxal phosphate-containing UPF0001 family protein